MRTAPPDSAESVTGGAADAALPPVWDERVLSDLARHGGSPVRRMRAVSWLRDQEVLSDVAQHDPHYLVRFMATMRVSDEAVLYRSMGRGDAFGVFR